MEDNYIRLRERYAHESATLMSIVKDWDKYLVAHSEIFSAWKDFDMVGDQLNFDEKTRKAKIQKEEIIKRFEILLSNSR